MVDLTGSTATVSLDSTGTLSLYSDNSIVNNILYPLNNFSNWFFNFNCLVDSVFYDKIIEASFTYNVFGSFNMTGTFVNSNEQIFTPVVRNISIQNCNFKIKFGLFSTKCLINLLIISKID